MKNTKISFITIFMLALALLLVLYFYLLYGRFDDKIKALDVERSGYQKEYAILVENMDKTDKLKQEVSNKNALAAALSGKLEHKDALNIADEVYKAMGKVGLNEKSVTSVSVGETQRTGVFTSDNREISNASISLFVNSTWEVTQKFLQEFENSENTAFYVPTVTMTKADDGEHYSISITYYFAQKAEEKADATLEDGTTEDGYDELLDENQVASSEAK